MFKKLQLTFHLFFLYGILGVSLAFLFGYCLFVVHGYEETIKRVDRENLPLARIVAEISRYQWSQTLRFSEVLLFARIHNREKFEISNEGYVYAGKRLGDEILEGRSFIKKGTGSDAFESRLKQLEAIKALLTEIEKAHGEYERFGALLIRGIYQYDFLSNDAYLLSGDHMAAEEEAAKQMAFLRTNLASLEEATQRLEIAIEAVVEQVKQLSHTLAIDAGKRRETTFNLLLPVVVFGLVFGAALVFFIIKIQKERERSRHHLMRRSLAVLSDALTQLQRAFRDLEPPSRQLEKSMSHQMRAFGETLSACQEGVQLSEKHRQLSAQIQGFGTEKNSFLEQITLLVQQLNKDAEDMLTTEVKTGRIVRDLKETVMQINVLASSASAEASRSEAGRSLAVFSEEIKKLTQSTLVALTTVSKRMDRAIKGIHADRLHVTQTRQQFLEVVALSRKEVDLSEQMVVIGQRQFVVSRTVRDAVTEVHTVLQNNDALLEQAKTARNTAQSQVRIAYDSVGGWPG